MRSTGVSYNAGRNHELLVRHRIRGHRREALVFNNGQTQMSILL
jgi:hypothetical protein